MTKLQYVAIGITGALLVAGGIAVAHKPTAKPYETTTQVVTPQGYIPPSTDATVDTNTPVAEPTSSSDANQSPAVQQTSPADTTAAPTAPGPVPSLQRTTVAPQPGGGDGGITYGQ